MSKTGVALLGFGQWGRNVARNFSRLGALRVVSDPDPRALEAAGKVYPGVRLASDVLANSEVRACAIAAPAALHHDLAHRAYYSVPFHLQGCFSDLRYKAGDFPESERARRSRCRCTRS